MDVHCWGMSILMLRPQVAISCRTSSQSGWRPTYLIESRVQTLIIQTAAQRLKLLAELPRVSSHHMCVKGLLVLPRFQEHEMVRPAVSLQHLKPHIAFLLAARLTVLSEERHGLTLG